MLTSFFILVSLIDYDPDNYHVYPPTGSSPLLGQVGIFVARYLFVIFGLSAWLIPWFFAVCSWNCFILKRKNKNLFPIPFIILSVCLMGNLKDVSNLGSGNQTLMDCSVYEHGSGGSLGSLIYSGLPIFESTNNQIGGFLRFWIGEVGSWLLSISLLLFSCSAYFCKLFPRAKTFFELVKKSELRKDYKEKTKNFKDNFDKSIQANKSTSNNSTLSFSSLLSFFKKEVSGKDPLFGDVSMQESEYKGTDKDSKTIKTYKSKPKPKALEEEPRKVDSVKGFDSNSIPSTLDVEEKDVSDLQIDDGFKVVRAEKTEKSTDLFPERKGDYHFPTLDLLMEPPEVHSGGDEDHMIKAKRLKETLSEFKIDVELGEVHTGPVITLMIYTLLLVCGLRKLPTWIKTSRWLLKPTVCVY